MLQALPWDPRMPPLQLKTLDQARREIGAVRTSKNVLRLTLGFCLWFRGGVGVLEPDGGGVGVCLCVVAHCGGQSTIEKFRREASHINHKHSWAQFNCCQSICKNI